MARSNELVFALNAGGVDPEALTRVDLEKMRVAGEHPVSNWFPKVTGPMTLRPGFEDALDLSSQSRMLRFVRSVSQTYVLAMSANEMRVVSDDAVVQIPTHSTTMSSGSWTDASDAGASITASAAAGGGSKLEFSGTASGSSRARQTITVAGGDTAVEHITRIVVALGPVFMRVGTVAGGQDVLADTLLNDGTHKISFVPGTTTVYIEVRSDDLADREVTQIDFEASLTSGDLVIPTPWSFSQLEKLRTWQTIDIVYCGDGEQQPREIQHRGVYSWSVITYKNFNGPYDLGSDRIGLTPSATTGNCTVTASNNTFESGHVGALLELTHDRKTISQELTGEDQQTDYITVTGVDAARIFFIELTDNSFVGTVTLQRSVEADEPVVWVDYRDYTSGALTKTTEDDGQDNLVAHYRWRINTGNYTSGSVTVLLDYLNTNTTGQAVITGYTSNTQVDAEIRVPFGANTETKDWRVGRWSDVNGWPRVPIIHDDRLHWFDDAGRDYASEVDDYVDFDDTLEGDSAPFTRSVSGGSLEGIVWAKSDDRLVVGATGHETTIQANDLDEPLTPTAYTTRTPSRRGCADVDAENHHSGIFYVQRAGSRLFELSIPPSRTYYRSQNISRLNPGACNAGIVRLAVQMHPETRLYAVLQDGTMVVLTYELDDEVIAFNTITINGALIEDVVSIPGTDQDYIYVIASKSGQRSLLKLANELAQEDVATCTLLDYHKVLTGTVSSISGATSFASQTVQIWADGQRRADVTLDGSGNGTLDGTYSRVVYGQSYEPAFKSTTLAYAAQLGTAVAMEKTIRNIGLVVSKTCLDGLKVGPNAALAENVPTVIDGVERSAYEFFEHKKIPPFAVPNDFDPDTRFYVTTNSADGPVTVQGVVLDVETREGYTPPRG